jgi:hypothetical protein
MLPPVPVAPPNAAALHITASTTSAATQPSPKYKAVPTSAAFQAWKVSQGISANVFAAASPPPTHTPLVPEAAPHGVSEGVPTSVSEGVLYGVPEGAPQCNPSTVPVTDPGRPYPLAGLVHLAAPSPGDTLTQSAMLCADDSVDFIQAQTLEISTLHQAGVFSYHPISSIPPRVKLLNAIWSYRRKRSPSAGEFRKYKARICTNGSKQQ